MSVIFDADTIIASFAVENPREDQLYPDNALTLTSEAVVDAGQSNAKWLERIGEYKTQLGDPRALRVARELAATKRRTLLWLNAITYQGILSLWREDTKGLVAVVNRFEEETGEPFSAPLILDFMESHDSWPIDLDDIYRTHAYLHEARWQQVAEDADEFNMVSVAKAKQLSELMFERAGTLNREKFSKVVPRDDTNSGNIINVVVNKDGSNQVGVDRQQIATRQQLTAKARVRYGTSRYVDPPGLSEWQRGDFDIPDSRVDDYLMLKWIPETYGQVLPNAVAEQETDAVPVDPDTQSLDVKQHRVNLDDFSNA